jgi:hypothetical protein
VTSRKAITSKVTIKPVVLPIVLRMVIFIGLCVVAGAELLLAAPAAFATEAD